MMQLALGDCSLSRCSSPTSLDSMKTKPKYVIKYYLMLLVQLVLGIPNAIAKTGSLNLNFKLYNAANIYLLH